MERTLSSRSVATMTIELTTQKGNPVRIYAIDGSGNRGLQILRRNARYFEGLRKR
jgi:hypothetical protein